MVDSFDDHAAGNGVKCCVYWLFDETCSVPENDGYVGISTDLPQRLREHKSKSRRTWTGGVARSPAEMERISTDSWLAMSPEDRIGCVFDMWDEQMHLQDPRA